jgi:hypothetical protein
VVAERMRATVLSLVPADGWSARAHILAVLRSTLRLSRLVTDAEGRSFFLAMCLLSLNGLGE